MHKFILKNRVFVDVRGSTLNESFSIWEEYLAEARSHVESLSERAIEIKYEDFLEYPSEILKTVAEFCELDVPQSKIESVASTANKSRAYAYLNDPELKAFSENMADKLKSYGY